MPWLLQVSVPVADDASAAPRVSESTLWPLWVVIPLGVSLVIPVFALWVNYGEGVPVGEVEAAGALAEARQTPNIEFTRERGVVICCDVIHKHALSS